MIGRNLLEPSSRRTPNYDSAQAADATASLAFPCSRCGSALALEVDDLVRGAYGGGERELGDSLAEAARMHFGLGIVGKSHDGGFTSLRRVVCSACGGAFLVYAGVREPANGWIQITLQGVAELAPDPPAV